MFVIGNQKVRSSKINSFNMHSIKGHVVANKIFAYINEN